PDEMIQQIEEQILMIEKESEKDTVDVARRLLPPPEENILKPGETPAFSLDNTTLPSQGTQISSSAIPRIVGTSPSTEQTGSETGETNPVPVVLEPIEPPIPLEQVLEQEIIEQPIIEEAQKEKENRPYEFWDDLFELQLKTYFEQDKTQGFFQLVISPKKDAKIIPLPKQVAFIIDSSASIGQRKLDRTVQGVCEALQQLRDDDLFNIILFRERATFFAEGYIKATPENKNSARKYLKQIPSIGQTDVFNSVRQIIQLPTTPGLPNILWLYSDGKPTIGLRDTRAIIANLTLENQGRYEIFTTGGGNTVDRYLLELLAYLNRGFCVIRNNIEQISTMIPQAFQKIQNPILIDVSMDFGAIPREEIYPFIFPNFYQGVPVSIFGKFNPQTQKNFVFRLQGNSAGKRKEIIFRTDLSHSDSGDFEIAQRWAFHKAFYIIGRIVREGEKPELLQILKELKEKYNVKTTYTP
ncbi:MAG: VWA domain-containing protein, partial [Candidatus Hydrogenedens sp.]